jgi:hypothetical protein
MSHSLFWVWRSTFLHLIQSRGWFYMGISDPTIAVSISNDAIRTIIDGSKIVY